MLMGAILQLKWLNQELIKIWPFVNAVCIPFHGRLELGFDFFYKYAFLQCLLLLSIVVAGSIRTDQNLRGACS